MDAWNAALTVYDLLILLLINIKIPSSMQVKLLFWIKSVKILEIGRIESILKTLFKSTYDIKVLLIVANLWWSMLAFLLYILLIVKVHDFRVTLL